jgi:phosphoglucomutase
MDYLMEYQSWMQSNIVDEETKQELLGIKDDEKEIKERFSKHLEFGTGGLRGIIGAGTNRMNKYVVRRATQGIADYIKQHAGEEGRKKGVVIAFDCRYCSDFFALEAALVLAANDIKVYLFEGLRPTPELSFAVRHLGAVAGINITASHNPPKYNGYKVYWEDGGQIPPHISDSLLKNINNLPMFSANTMDKQKALQSGLVEIIGQETDKAFIEAVYMQSINKDAARRAGDDFKLIYTPIHGTGNMPVREILKKSGFKNVFVVKEQEKPNGAFPTVKSPNPEEKESLELAIRLAQEKNANLIIGTDPDADRVGIAVLSPQGEYVTLSGNQVGALLTYYILSEKAEKNILPDNAAVISTIVSTKITEKICEKFNVKLFKTFTGFKFIGEKILEFEKEQTYEYIFGFEESYGYLAGTHARDKDGVVASMLIAEMAACYFEEGKSLYEVMEDIYRKFGGFAEETISITREGIDGLAQIKETMQKLRSNKPRKFGQYEVTAIRDYFEGIRYDFEGNNRHKLNLPCSDVLYFELAGGSDFAVRPSGTEPKIKIYFLARGETKNEADSVVKKIKEAVLSSPELSLLKA